MCACTCLQLNIVKQRKDGESVDRTDTSKPTWKVCNVSVFSSMIWNTHTHTQTQTHTQQVNEAKWVLKLLGLSGDYNAAPSSTGELCLIRMSAYYITVSVNRE